MDMENKIKEAKAKYLEEQRAEARRKQAVISRRWYIANIEKHRENARIAGRKYYAANREEIQARTKALRYTCPRCGVEINKYQVKQHDTHTKCGLSNKKKIDSQ
jgi:predicted RNA-binding Zn-ribbon protein involved in translation (DUF1610 family)